MQHLYSNLRVSKNYALGTKLSLFHALQKVTENSSGKVRNNEKEKPAHVQDEKIGIISFFPSLSWLMRLAFLSFIFFFLFL